MLDGAPVISDTVRVAQWRRAPVIRELRGVGEGLTRVARAGGVTGHD